MLFASKEDLLFNIRKKITFVIDDNTCVRQVHKLRIVDEMSLK